MRPRSALLLAIALTLAGALAIGLVPEATADATTTVSVRSNFYDPQSVTVRPGDTVTWAWRDGGHSVTSVSGADQPESFDSGVLIAGSTFRHTYTTEGLWSFYCSIHPVEMRGQVIVDDGSGPTPTSSTTSMVPTPVVHVPEDQPSIEAALDVVAPGGIVSVADGTYAEALKVTKPGVSIEGRSGDPARVRIDGLDGAVGPVGIAVSADDVRIRGVTVAAFGDTGIRVRDTDGFAVVDTAVEENPVFGILAERSARGQLRAVRVDGASIGIAVQRCSECDTVIDRVEVEGTGPRRGRSGIGIRVRDAQSVTVTRSEISNLTTGILLVSSDARHGAPQRGAHLWGNTLNRISGTGIHVQGGWHDVVEANEVRSAHYGIRVTGVPVPSYSVRVVANTVRAASAAGLSWDGAGVAVCFSDNTAGPEGDATTEPPMLQTVARC